VAIEYKNKTLHSHTHSYHNAPTIEIEATLEEPVYSGNNALPLVKNFMMTYHCGFTTVKSPSGHRVNGQIEGEVTAKVYGLCSHKKAKELASEEARKNIASYFQQQLNL